MAILRGNRVLTPPYSEESNFILRCKATCQRFYSDSSVCKFYHYMDRQLAEICARSQQVNL